LYSLTLLGHEQYSTMVEIPFSDEQYALSLDFNQEQLDQILSKATPQVSTSVRRLMTCDPLTPRTIDFEGEVIFGVRARLGELQRVKHENFVPLIAQEILQNASKQNYWNWKHRSKKNYFK
jgi:hypothetical protein